MTYPAQVQKESSSSSSDEEDSEDASQPPPSINLQPVFVAKSERVRLKEEEESNELEELRQLEALQVSQSRREEQTRALVREIVETEKAEAEEMRLGIERGLKSAVENNSSSLSQSGEDEMPSDEISEEDMKVEFEKWKLRELARLKRDWLKRNSEFLKQLEKDSRRRLSDQEKAEENERLRIQRLEISGLKKGKMKFMQKYFHKGAFYQNIVETGKEEAFKKDFNEAIGSEKVDIKLLPKCMQIRSGDFGKRSRSKYTHLKDQDTTDRTAGWNK